MHPSLTLSCRPPAPPTQELAGVFERLVSSLAAGDLGGAADAALRFAYYWCAACQCLPCCAVPAALPSKRRLPAW